MTLASLGHDDIQFYLATNKNSRFKILKKICPEMSGFIQYHNIGFKEYHLKIPYEHEINIDFLDLFYNQNVAVIWEIKSVLLDLGETLRQLNRYERLLKQYIKNPILKIFRVLIYNVCKKYTEEQLKQYYLPENVLVYRILPSECQSLEEKNGYNNNIYTKDIDTQPQEPYYSYLENFFYVGGKMSFLLEHHYKICSSSQFELKTAIEIGLERGLKEHEITNDDIVTFDINAIEDSKGTIAIITEQVQVGTITEILFCKTLHKPLLIIFVDGKICEIPLELTDNIIQKLFYGIPDKKCWFIDDYWFLIKYLYKMTKRSSIYIVNNSEQINTVIENWIKKEFVL